MFTVITTKDQSGGIYNSTGTRWPGIYDCSKQTSSSDYTLGLSLFTAINPWHLCYILGWPAHPTIALFPGPSHCPVFLHTASDQKLDSRKLGLGTRLHYHTISRVVTIHYKGFHSKQPHPNTQHTTSQEFGGTLRDNTN